MCCLKPNFLVRDDGQKTARPEGQREQGTVKKGKKGSTENISEYRRAYRHRQLRDGRSFDEQKWPSVSTRRIRGAIDVFGRCGQCRRKEREYSRPADDRHSNWPGGRPSHLRQDIRSCRTDCDATGHQPAFCSSFR